MQLTAQQVFDAAPVLAAIINEKRPMPQKGKYRVARLHAKLLPEYNVIATQRDALITAYDYRAPDVVDGVIILDKPSATFSVPLDKVGEFNEAWKAIAETTITVEVEPIPLEHLTLADDTNGSIEAHELATLGDLVTE